MVRNKNSIRSKTALKFRASMCADWLSVSLDAWHVTVMSIARLK